jgi:hypothetical protein
MTPIHEQRPGDTIAVARKAAKGHSNTPRRGTQANHHARPGRQAPLSRRQGAPLTDVTPNRKQRPGDTIAVARKAARETA